MPEKRIAAVAIIFAAGILAAEYLPHSLVFTAAGGAAFIALIPIRGHPRITLAILATVFALSAARYIASRQMLPNDISLRRAQAFVGVVASDPDMRQDRVQFVLRAERAECMRKWRAADGSVMVSMYSANGTRLPAVEYGDRLYIHASVYTPTEPTNPGQFSWKGYLARQGIHSCASVRDPAQMKPAGEHGGNALVRAALKARRGIIRSIGRIHPRQEASVVAGMVLGTYSYLSPETFDNFTRTGTLHLLAASGYNCWILLALAAPMLSFARIMPKRRSIIIICLLILYLLMTGAKPSLLRATIMASLLLAASLFKRSPNLKNLFFTAGLVVLIIKPSDLFDVGFQLSFLAVWSLISVAPVIESILARSGFGASPAFRAGRMILLLHKLRGTLVATAVATSAVSLVTAPIVAHYFNYLSLVSLPANIALALGVPLVFADGGISILAAHIPLLGKIVGSVGSLITNMMLDIVNWLGSMRYSAVSVASPGALAMAGYYRLLYAALNWIKEEHA